MALNKWNYGGGLAGAAAGFLLGGPVGALIGGGTGAVGGGWAAKAMLPKTTTNLTLTASDQSVSASKGGVVGIQAPAGGKVVSLSPATGSPVGHLEVKMDHGFAAATASGDINVLWSDPAGHAQATVVHLTVV